jgi:hypothetical protein
MKIVALTLCLLVGVSLVGCDSGSPNAAQEKEMRTGLQDTNPDLSKMRPQDRAMMEKFMKKPAGGGPPAPPPATPKP